ncbi:MAG: hypothetical protein R6X32_11335 [Chloroflexota bacterium]|jgi:hypothetical protein
MKESIWSGKPWQAFKTFAILFSFTMNLVLLIVLLVILPLILPIVNDIAVPIVGGLNTSFVEMNNAKIERVIQVEDTIPISFTLPLQQATTVVVMEPIPLQNIPARFDLPGGGGTIAGVVSLSLPQGLALPVFLNLEVPVDQTIPVTLAVDVEIPLNETELGAPFTRLEGIFTPLDALLRGLPNDAQDLRGRLLQPPPVPDTAVTTIPE